MNRDVNMNCWKLLSACVAAVALAACGGGGDAGSTSSTTTTTTTTPTTPTTSTVPTMAVSLSAGGTSVSASGSTVQAVVKDETGAVVAGRLVTFSGDATLVKFNPPSGQVLTDNNGVATVQVAPATVSSVGAGTLQAQAKVGATTLLTTFDFQLSASNLALQGLNLGTGALAAFGNRPISVLATINGVAATNTPVQVTLSASCGTVTPATVTTNALGVADTTYTASLATCAGTNVTITAGSVGAASVSGQIAVASSIATNVQFISTTPQLINLDGSVGTTQAQVVFKVVDSTGNPLQNKKLRLALSNSSTGVSLNTLGNSAPVELTTDSLGQVSAAVFSGTVPTSLNVVATLLDGSNQPTLIGSSSNLLTVAVGRPVQQALSLAVGKFSIEGMSIDGVSTDVTLSMADRQGNPVPAGTQVNFVTEAGVMLPPVCTVTDQSSCAVTLRSQGTRTATGRVSILAYVAGEENFVDVNGNNVFDTGEPFSDLGRAFRDDHGSSSTGTNGVYDTGEFQVPRVGAVACTQAAGCVGDGVWGAADVRIGATVVFASSSAVITTNSLTAATPFVGSSPVTNTLTSVTVSVSDTKGNSMATGSTIAVSTIDDGFSVAGTTGNNCAVSSTASFTVPNTLGSLSIPVILKACTAGDQLRVRVTSPSGFVTEEIFTVLAPVAPPP